MTTRIGYYVKHDEEEEDPGSYAHYNQQQRTLYSPVGLNCTDAEFGEWFRFAYCDAFTFSDDYEILSFDSKEDNCLKDLFLHNNVRISWEEYFPNKILVNYNKATAHIRRMSNDAVDNLCAK